MNYNVLVTGWMGSGKSTLMRQYNRPKIEFKAAPGLDTSSFDETFGLRVGSDEIHFYELDSPTVLGGAWVNYIEAAQGAIVVYDILEGPRYGTLGELLDHLLKHLRPGSPLLFLANKADTVEAGVRGLVEAYNPQAIEYRPVTVLCVLKGTQEAVSDEAPRLKLAPEQVRAVFDWMVESLTE